MGAVLEPDPRGFGTHEALGFAPCGFRAWLGGPCPTCGVTTSVVHVVRGEWGRSLQVQPFGALLVAALFVAAVCAIRVHKRGDDLSTWVRKRGGVWLAFGAIALVSLWALRV